MFEHIHWHAFLRVANERKVAGHLRRFGEAADCEMPLQFCERYWKDRTLFDVMFMSALGAETVSEAVFKSLCICQKVMPSWTVSGPRGYANETWEFSGHSMNETQGIVLILFRLDNFKKE